MNKNTVVTGAISLHDATFVANVAEKTLDNLKISTEIEYVSEDSVAIYLSPDMGKNYDAVCIIYNDSRPISWGILGESNPDLDSVFWWSRYAEVVTAINQTRFSFVNESDRVDMNYVAPDDIASLLS